MAKEACLLLKNISRHAHSFPCASGSMNIPAQAKTPSAHQSVARFLGRMMNVGFWDAQKAPSQVPRGSQGRPGIIGIRADPETSPAEGLIRLSSWQVINLLNEGVHPYPGRSGELSDIRRR